jgi:hypothetical protein
MTTFDKVVKFWPLRVSTPTPLMIMLATEFEMAGTDDKGIERICDLISDLCDEKFTDGINAAANHF